MGIGDRKRIGKKIKGSGRVKEVLLSPLHGVSTSALGISSCKDFCNLRILTGVCVSPPPLPLF